jgi:hypothetical protein
MIAGLTVLALALAACGTTPSPSPSPRFATPAPSPAASAPASATVIPSTAGDGGPSGAAASPRASLALDETLLAILPADVDGVPVTQEPDSFALAAADPAFATNVGSAAFGIVVDGNDLASGVVARLRPGRYSDGLFRDWRDTYDAGACAPTGGVAGNAQADMGGRTVYITTCAGGLRTYHAYVPERDVIVSLFSVGDRRFGEQLMGGLRP